MSIKVDWTFQAKDDYWQNIEYLVEEWTEKEIISFIDKVDDLIALLQTGTAIFKKSDYHNVFQVPVVPQVTLYYHYVNDTTIELLRFWNNLQDPQRLRL